LWCSVSADVKVLGRPSQLEVPDTTADQVGLKAVTVQPVENLESVFIDVLA